MQTEFRNWLFSTFAVTVFALPVGAALLLTGCNAQDGISAAPTGSAAPTATPTPTVTASAPQSALPRLDGNATVVMSVKGSPITIEVYGADAPITAGNFVDLVEKKVYDGLVFHRVVREPQPFVVQGGDPQGKNPNFPIEQLGTGGYVDPATSQPRNIPLEIEPENANEPVYGKTLDGVKPKLKHTRAAVAMARSSFPDSASSQFYVALADLNFLDGNYAVFGKVTQGMDVVDKIQQGDRIESAKVTQGIENLKVGATSPSSASPTTTP
ncbi:peptidylprolyl isomerase [Myxacorys almedinensis A]|uniref:Peptidyl-prolyl cis-trans isomerase n=1 Tax=Myxacorys almedinensis A TaxID=2690445 RepID=A0A8J8CJX5_9CYAN|nr:peptidylprolyl isomerase [Myxacorys almedinensis A]